MRVLIVCLFCLFPAAQQAQTVTGAVLDSVSRTAVERGFVVLLDSLGNEVDRTQTDRAGHFELEASASGTYRLKSLRVGYRTWTSPPFSIGRGEIVDHEMLVAALPIRLAAIEATEEDRCDFAPSEGTTTAALWGEVEKALSAATWTANNREYRFSTLLVTRDLDARGSRIGSEQQTRHSGLHRTPFQSRPAAELSRLGYIRPHEDGTATYYAPDADVLLSTIFQQEHCFSVVRDSRDRAGYVGLAFRPVEGRELTDVAGTLWLDESASELRFLEYRYTGLPRSIQDDRIGGYLEFMRLPADVWVVSGWNIRMPLISAYNYMDRARDSVLAGFRDNGGEVTRLTERNGTVVFEAEYANLVGLVFDSTRGQPLQGASVTIEGSGDTARTRWDGSFVLTGPYDGEYEVRFSHPRVDSLMYSATNATVSMARGQTSRVNLSIPDVQTLHSSLCADEERTLNAWTIVGTVRVQEPGAPADDAEVFVSWQALQVNERFMQGIDMDVTARTDNSGVFTVCNVPSGRPLTLFARKGELVSDLVDVTFENGMVTVGGRVVEPVADGIWSQHMTLLAAGSGQTGVSGTVIDSETGTAISGVEIAVDGADRTTVSNDSGFFELSGLAPGTVRLAMRHIGYHQQTIRIENLRPGQMLELPPDSPRMAPIQAALLNPVVVTGRRTELREVRLRPFFARREQGTGGFVTREEFEEWHPLYTTDILRRVRGVRIVPNPNYGRGDSRKFIVESSRGLERVQGGACPMLYFLDGAFIGNADDDDIDVVVSTNNIEAIEAYSGPSQMPPAFNMPGSRCGVIAFWTR